MWVRLNLNLLALPQARGMDSPSLANRELILIYTCRLRGLLGICIIALESV
jgi:hypothetical protein